MMDEILTAIDSLSLELQAAQLWALQVKLEKVKCLLQDKIYPQPYICKDGKTIMMYMEETVSWADPTQSEEQ